MNEITIPLRYLQAARLFAPKRPDVRPHLNGVSIKSGKVMATDGVYAAAIETHSDQVLSDVIIPLSAIDFFVKKMGRSSVKDVAVRWADGGKGELVGGTAFEPFRAVEGVFPDVMRVIPEVAAPHGHPQFQWHLLAQFEKAAEVLGTKRGNPLKALMLANGEGGTARVVLPGHPYFKGALCAFREKEASEALNEFFAGALV